METFSQNGSAYGDVPVSREDFSFFVCNTVLKLSLVFVLLEVTFQGKMRVGDEWKRRKE